MATLTITPNPLIQPATSVEVYATELPRQIMVYLMIDEFKKGTSKKTTKTGRVRFTTTVSQVGARVVQIKRAGDNSVVAQGILTVQAAQPEPPPPTNTITISNVVPVPTQTAVVIDWHTNIMTTGKLDYRLNGTLTWTTRQPVQLTPDYMDHKQDISGLTADSLYEFRITATDGATASATYSNTFRTLAPVVTPPPPSGDLPPPPSGQDAAALINQTLVSRDVRLQNGATYVCKSKLVRPSGRTLDLNGATVLFTFIGDGMYINGGTGTVGGGTLQGAYTSGGFTSDDNHGVHILGGGPHKFPDLWIKDFQGDAYYLQQYGTTPGNGIEITGGGFKHVGRMGLGIVAFDGGHVADWTAEDCYTPLDFEPDPNDWYTASTSHWLIERVMIRGLMNGSDGSGSKWLNLGSPQRQSAAFYQHIEDVEVRYCDINVTSPTTPHNAMGTDNDGAHYRAKNLRIHHNTVHQTFYRGGLFEHVDGLVLTDNVTPVRSSPWALINDCSGVTNERNG